MRVEISHGKSRSKGGPRDFKRDDKDGRGGGRGDRDRHSDSRRRRSR